MYLHMYTHTHAHTQPHTNTATSGVKRTHRAHTKNKVNQQLASPLLLSNSYWAKYWRVGAEARQQEQKKYFCASLLLSSSNFYYRLAKVTNRHTDSLNDSLAHSHTHRHTAHIHTHTHALILLDFNSVFHGRALCRGSRFQATCWTGHPACTPLDIHFSLKRTGTEAQLGCCCCCYWGRSSHFAAPASRLHIFSRSPYLLNQIVRLTTQSPVSK